ncbi:hypothetical protein V8E36_008100 [Tilletia maclaganii]
MSGAFDDEDFISFNAASGSGALGAAPTAQAAGATRNRIAGLLASASARRETEKSPNGATAGSRSSDVNASSTPPTGSKNGPGAAGSGSSTAVNATASTSSRGANGSRQLAGTKRKHNEVVAEEKRLTKKEKQELYAASTPWSVEVDWDRCRNGAEMLHREIMAFDEWLMPTKAEIECRDMVIALIAKAIRSKWADADVRPFGSHNTRLYLPEGDIDLVVLSASMNSQPREVVLRNMAYILRTNNLTTGDVQVIAKAKVPIIKFNCSYGDYKVDISVNQANGLTAADYVCDSLEKQPALRPLIMVVKQLLSSRNLSEVYLGGLGSYSVILTVISFMQMHPRIQRCEIDPARNLGVLLLEMLELYGKRFGYEELGISVRGNGSYFNKSMRGWVDYRASTMKMSIEDPLDPNNDVASGSYNFWEVRSALAGAFDLLTSAIGERSTQLGGPSGTRPTADQIRQAAKQKSQTGNSRYENEEDNWAREMLMQDLDRAGAKDPMSLLGRLFGIKPSTIKHRKKIKRLWDSNDLQTKLGRPTARITPEPGPSSVSQNSSRNGRPQHDGDEQPESSAKTGVVASRKVAAHGDALRGSLASVNEAVVASMRAGVEAHSSRGQRGSVTARAQQVQEEEESRYASSGKQKRKATDALLPSGSREEPPVADGRSAESAFYLDDSASSGAESEDRVYAAAADTMYNHDEDVSYAAPAPKRQRLEGTSGSSRAKSGSDQTSPSKKRATRKEVDAYWAGKGNSLAVDHEEDDDDDVILVE